MTESTSSKRSIVAEHFLKQVNKLSAGRKISDKYFGVIKHLHPKSDPTCRYKQRQSRLFSVSQSTIMPSGAYSIRRIRSYINAWKEEPEMINSVRSSEVLA